MATSIKTCKCEHKFQDERYGKQQRVHNSLKNTGKVGAKWRCTVCGEKKD